ncbi:MAG: LysR family transcriptional regulator [Microthrixaceae bacterium]
MDIKQLRAVSAVGSHHSFSAAARSLDTVQSNISAHVSRLEKELGVTLVDRADNALTPEGTVVAARAGRIEAELDALASDLAALRDEVVGSVRLGVIGTTARWLVPMLLDHLAEVHPGIRLTLLDGTTSVLIPRVVEGDLNLAVVSQPSDEPAISVETLFDEDLVLVVGSSHPLAGSTTVRLADLDGWEVMLDVPGSRYRALLDARCEEAGITLRPKAEIEGLRLIASLAFAGYGAAVLPASAAPNWAGGSWVAIPIVDIAGRTVGLARRRPGMPSAASRAVAQAIADVVRTNAGSQNGIRTHPQ